MVNSTVIAVEEYIEGGQIVRKPKSQISWFDSKCTQWTNTDCPIYCETVDDLGQKEIYHKVKDIADMVRKVYPDRHNWVIRVYKLSGDNGRPEIDTRGGALHDTTVASNVYSDGTIVPLKPDFLVKYTNHTYITTTPWPNNVGFKIWYDTANDYVTIVLPSDCLTIKHMKIYVLRALGYQINDDWLDYTDSLMIYKHTNTESPALPNDQNLHYDPVDYTTDIGGHKYIAALHDQNMEAYTTGSAPGGPNYGATLTIGKLKNLQLNPATMGTEGQYQGQSEGSDYVIPQVKYYFHLVRERTLARYRTQPVVTTIGFSTNWPNELATFCTTHQAYRSRFIMTNGTGTMLVPWAPQDGTTAYIPTQEYFPLLIKNVIP